MHTSMPGLYVTDGVTTRVLRVLSQAGTGPVEPSLLLLDFYYQVEGLIPNILHLAFNMGDMICKIPCSTEVYNMVFRMLLCKKTAEEG